MVDHSNNLKVYSNSITPSLVPTILSSCNNFYTISLPLSIFLNLIKISLAAM